MNDQAVITFDTETIMEIKRIVMDRDSDAALAFVRKIERKINDGMSTKVKGPV
jgi:hypothetical protein